jgi:hypothetical protein
MQQKPTRRVSDPMQEPHTPICPKCGYDQSGAIAAWETRCPLGGQCPECGFAFSWADVINPSRVVLPWYVEHALSRGDLVKRTVPTLWFMLFPNRYWSRMKMESSRSLKRYLLWIFILMLALHLLASAAQVGATYTLAAHEQKTFAQLLAGLPPNQQASFQTQFAPFATDLGSFDFWYPTIMGALLEPLISRYWIGSSSLQLSSVPLAFGVLGICLMWFIMFCAFPISRKRAQLRVIHVWRATIVGGFLPLICIDGSRLIGATLDTLDYAVFGGQGVGTVGSLMQLGNWIGLAILFGVLIWVQWFWVAARACRWRVRANWFSILLVIIASLFGFVLAGVMMLAFELISLVVEYAAVWMGV